MKLFIVFFTLLMSLNAEDFITKMEYAKMLYENPRGIGCNKCHGSKGERTVIATYKHKGEKRELVAPAINNLSKKRFFAALEDSSSVMPKYFLTEQEIEILYFYVTTEVNR